MTRVAVVSNDDRFAGDLRTAIPPLSEGLAVAWSDEYLRLPPAEVVSDIARVDPAVVCLGPGLERHLALALAGGFDREHPEICVVIVDKSTPTLLREALAVGVRDVLAPDAAPEELARSIGRAADTASRRRANLSGAPKPAREDRVLCVVSPKGGSGKTMVVSNLAVALAASHPGQVAALDLDLLFGDLAASLALAPDHTMLDVARAQAGLDATTLKVFLAQHRSGLFALCAPESPIDGESVTDQDAGRVLKLLRSEFPIVLVDTSAGLDAPTLAAVEAATDVVFVCTTDVASVRALRKEIDALDSLGLSVHRRHFVLNRCDARVGLEVQDIEGVVGLGISASVPSTRAVPVSLNEGVPLCESAPRSPITKALRTLAGSLIDAGADRGRPSRRQWWR